MFEVKKNDLFVKSPVAAPTTKGSWLNLLEKFIRIFRPFLAVLIVLLLLLAGWFIYNLLNNEGRALSTERERLALELAAKNQELAGLQNAKTNYENLTGVEKKILEILPPQKDLPSIFAQLDALAFKNNLLLSNVDITVPPEEAEASAIRGLGQLLVTLSLSGSDYFSLKNFLAGLQKNLRLFDIVSINYEPTTKDFNLVLRTYYYAE